MDRICSRLFIYVNIFTSKQTNRELRNLNEC
jgi:hypothetical protein